MKCEQARELFGDFIDRELSLPLQLELKKHMKICSSCTEEFQKLRKSVAIINAAKKIEPPSDYSKQVKSELKRRLGEIVK